MNPALNTLTSALWKNIRPQYLVLLISVLLVILPHFPRLPLWLSLYCLFIIGWRYAYDTGRVGLPNTLLRLVLTITPIIFLAISYHTILGKQPGSALLSLMLCLKLLEMRNNRDVTVIIFLGYFIVITGFLFSQSIFIGLYMFMVIISLTTTLIAFNHHSLDKVTTNNPLLMHIKLATRLLLHSVPLAVLLFILFPRIPGPLWGLPEDPASGITGLSDSMEPGRISHLSNSNAVAFRVKFKQTLPPANKLYWRGPVMGTYSGRRWSITNTKNWKRKNLSYKHSAELTDYTITLEPHNQNWLFALDLPAVLPAGSRLTSELQLLSNKNIKEIYRYDMQSYIDYQYTQASLLELNEYKRIPANASPRTRQLVQQLRQQSENDSQYVRKVLDYFRQQPFYYSREPPLLFDDPVDEFMFETQKGYCEHFSSAFTVMMRIAGVPARVVTGYQGGEMNPLSDYMIVRQSNAHAWSEVWLTGRGWVRVDPTSVIPPHRVESTDDLARIQPEQRVNILSEQNWLTQAFRQTGFAWDAINNRWNQWIVGYNEKKQTAFLKSLGLENTDWQKMTFILFVALTLVLLFIAWLVFQPDKKEMDPVQKIYLQFINKIAKYGYEPETGETPLSFSRRITTAREDISPQVETITRLYNQLRYTMHSNKELLDQLKSAVRAFSVTKNSD